MRLLVTGDWHWDWVTGGYTRFQDVSQAVEQTVAEAKRQRVDAYVCLGDITNPDSGSCVFQVMEMLLRTAIGLEEAGIPSWWIPGNHDVILDGTGNTTLAPLRALGGKLIRVFEKPSSFAVADEEVVMLPYADAAHDYDPEEFLMGCLARRAPKCRRTYVFGHMTHIPGARLGEETSEMPRGRAMPFPMRAIEGVDRLMLFNGHYHQPQDVHGIHIPGALQRLTHGEETNTPGYLVVGV